MAELAIDLPRPRHELEAEPVVDHREPSGRQGEAFAISAGDVFARRRLQVRQAGFGGELGADGVQLAAAERAPSAIFRKLAEAFVLVGGVKVFAGDVLVQADLGRIVLRVDHAADGLGLLDLLALGAQQLRQPPAFADGDEVEAGFCTLGFKLRLHNQILQEALGMYARRLRLDRGLAVRRLAGIPGRLLELVERAAIARPATASA